MQTSYFIFLHVFGTTIINPHVRIGLEIGCHYFGPSTYLCFLQRITGMYCHTQPGNELLNCYYACVRACDFTMLYIVLLIKPHTEAICGQNCITVFICFLNAVTIPDLFLSILGSELRAWHLQVLYHLSHAPCPFSFIFQ